MATTAAIAEAVIDPQSAAVETDLPSVVVTVAETGAEIAHQFAAETEAETGIEEVTVEVSGVVGGLHHEVLDGEDREVLGTAGGLGTAREERDG